ncbi:MAG: hypothetical protein RR128_08650 [Clostridium sp.]
MKKNLTKEENKEFIRNVVRRNKAELEKAKENCKSCAKNKDGWCIHYNRWCYAACYICTFKKVERIMSRK